MDTRYPTPGQGLDALITPSDAKNYPEGGYIKGGYPTDGWDNELHHASPGSEGRQYDLFSLGADGRGKVRLTRIFTHKYSYLLSVASISFWPYSSSL